ncbi:MAG TPA: type II toxin-antitoxin system VapC family toxin [Gemmataceae bacterium]|nr:type II toxin-antitoxin system VapC family toxin [Gemmataceae bacterium]
MLQFLLDTDHLTLFHHGHAAVGTKMAAQPAGTVGLAIVTAEEALRGRLATLRQAQTGPQRITRYSQLQETVELVNQFPIVPFDQTVESHFQQLWSLRLRVGTQDLKMAAVARANRLTLLTRNRRDFGRIPGLGLDDWSV